MAAAQSGLISNSKDHNSSTNQWFEQRMNVCVDIYNGIILPIVDETCCNSAINRNIFKGVCEESIKANWNSKHILGIIYQKWNVGKYTDTDIDLYRDINI